MNLTAEPFAMQVEKPQLMTLPTLYLCIFHCLSIDFPQRRSMAFQ